MEEFKRKLASIQVIDVLTPIKDADKIEQASLVGSGWSFVVKKGEFKTGDLCVYFEVDSVLPEKEEFEFLRSRKFRIKTIKLKGVISSGLVIPVPESMKGLDIGTDVTEAMGVRKYDPQAQEEAIDTEDKKHRSVVMKYLMGFKPFRSAYMFLNAKEKGNWPGWIAKTDEERIQNCAKLVLNHFNEEWYITEKNDGCMHEDVLLETSEGLKTIKEICSNRKRIKVSSFDELTGRPVFSNICGFSVKENNNNWYEVEVEDGVKLKLTGDHRVYLPELSCWRKVEELKGDEKLLLKR